VSDAGFRFTGDAERPSIVERFERSITTVERLPCDVLIAVHPSFSDLDGKLAARAKRPATNPFIDPDACRAYAAAARKRLAERVAEENKK
jgi:metallo-beta-lactamase class B